jgi:hypothetical protein
METTSSPFACSPFSIRGSSMILCMTALSPSVSFGFTVKPLTPSFTSSFIPPMSEVITGIPAMKASWMTSGETSYQVEGATRTSKVSSTLLMSSLWYGPSRTIRSSGDFRYDLYFPASP